MIGVFKPNIQQIIFYSFDENFALATNPGEKENIKASSYEDVKQFNARHKNMIVARTCLNVFHLDLRKILHCWDQFLSQLAPVIDLLDALTLTEINVKHDLIH